MGLLRSEGLWLGGGASSLLWLYLLGAATFTAGDSAEQPSFPNIRDDFFDPCVGLEAALLSQLVYGLDGDLNLTRVPDVYEPSLWFDQGSTEVLVSRKAAVIPEEGFSAIPPGSGVVTFRGSEEIADWIVNADQIKVPFGSPNHTINYPMFQPSSSSSSGPPEKVEILAHRGFNQVFRLYDEILEALAEVGFDDPSNTTSSSAPLYVQGHSLGGANALLFSIKYAFDHPETPVYATTFGAPRAGDRGMKLFAERLRNLNVWRSVFHNDIVPRVPSFDYEHTGHLHWKTPDQGVKAYYRQIGDRSKNFGGIKDFSVAVLRESIPSDLIGDHMMPMYIPWMEATCANPDFGTTDYQRLS